jgi:hypothetical protein
LYKQSLQPATSKAYPGKYASDLTQGVGDTLIKTYLCPSDNTLNPSIQRDGYASCSYAGNLLVFDPRGPGTLVSSMSDGTSNTVIFAERYKKCAPSYGGVTMPGWGVHPAFVRHGWDTPGFGWHDAGLLYDPNFSTADNPRGTPNGKIVPFEVAPSPATVAWAATQTAHTGTMQICLGDASVRGVSAGVSNTTWVRACTPNDGVPLGSDWDD